MMKNNKGKIHYLGQWINGLRHGDGFYEDDRDIIIGSWNNNKLHNIYHIILFGMKHNLRNKTEKYYDILIQTY